MRHFAPRTSITCRASLQQRSSARTRQLSVCNRNHCQLIKRAAESQRRTTPHAGAPIFLIAKRKTLVSRSIDAHAAHHTHTGAPVFVDIKAIDFDVGINRARQRGECGMDPKSRGYQVDKRRFIADFSIAEEFGARDMATAPVRLNALPIVNSLQDVLARLPHFQLNYNESSILSERQKINWTHP